jgi:hypothetical protein
MSALAAKLAQSSSGPGLCGRSPRSRPEAILRPRQSRLTFERLLMAPAKGAGGTPQDLAVSSRLAKNRPAPGSGRFGQIRWRPSFRAPGGAKCEEGRQALGPLSAGLGVLAA